MSRSSRSIAAAAAIAAVVSAEVAPVVETVVTEKPKSIRQLIMSGITAGKDTKTIAAEVQLHFPSSAAAAKSVKHIAWYRSRMKKDATTAATAAALLAKIDETTAS